MKGHYNVLFVCTGNSARSILAEALMNHLGRERFTAYSAGSHPKGQVHPMALDVLASVGLPTTGLRSKSWDEFSGPAAPVMDFVITVCDRAVGESCPAWPGHPITAHWSVPDPSADGGTPDQVRKAFTAALHTLQQRISLLQSLRIEALDRLAIRSALQGNALSNA